MHHVQQAAHAGILSQKFIDEDAGYGQFYDGHSLWFVSPAGGCRRYELRASNGHRVEHIGYAIDMTLDQAREKAAEMRLGLELRAQQETNRQAREAERRAREAAAERAALVREERVLDPDRNQFANPIGPPMLSRIMGAWVSASLAAAV